MHEGEFILLAAEKPRDLLAMLVERFVSPARVTVSDEGRGFVQVICDSINHRAWRNSQTAVVQKCAPAGQQKLLLPDALPVAFRIPLK
jgi:hypothetical protein